MMVSLNTAAGFTKRMGEGELKLARQDWQMFVLVMHEALTYSEN